MPVRLLLAAAFALGSLLALSGRAAELPRSEWQISLLTFGPGPVIFERYGHCAIRLHNTATEFDACYDWGNFDFNKPNFIPHFLAGRLDYSMEGKRTRDVLSDYIDAADRTVVEQSLNLTPAQIQRLIGQVAAMDDESHRYYPYDYFRDNCAIRIRDIVDNATEGAVHRALATPVPQTYRWHNRRLVPVGATNTLLCALMDFTMGPRVDAPLTRWDETFIPTTLADALDEVRLNDDAGERPLVGERRTLHATGTSMNAEPTAPPSLGSWTFLIGVVTALVMVWMAKAARPLFYLLVTGWSLFSGIGGIFLISIWSFTAHWPTAWNQNVLQFSPLSLIVLVALCHRRTRSAARKVAILILTLSVAGALVTISHLTLQRNAPAVLLAVPMHAAVLVGLQRSRRDGLAADVESPSISPQRIPT